MRRLAIVIAANGPEGSPDRLRFAESDGDRIGNALKGPLCGYEVHRLPADTPAHEVSHTVTAAAEQRKREDAFLTYFAGHGRPHEGELLLQLNGTSVESPNSTSLAVSDLMRAFRACKARSRVLILDCCSAGTVERQQGLRNTGTPVRELGIKSDTFDIVMAAGFLEYAFEDEEFGGGFLTSALCEALTERFNEADADRDRALSFDDAMRWLTRRAAEVNAKRSKDRQIPVPERLGLGKGLSYLTRPPGEWIVHEVMLPNGAPAVLLPIAPMTIAHGGKEAVEFAFVMGRSPVTNSDYKQFVEQTGRRPPMSGQGSVPFRPWEEAEFKGLDKPVVCVSVADAQAYCEWLTRKARAESRGATAVLLPLPEMWNVAVFRSLYEKLEPQSWMGVSAVIHHRARAPAPCTSAPERTSDLGLIDLVGNVWEWSGTKGDWIVGLGLDEEAQKSIERYRQYWLLSASHEYTGDPPDIFAPLPRMDKKLAWLLRRTLRGGGFRNNLVVTQPFRPSVNHPQLNPGEDISEIDLGFRVTATVSLHRLPPEVVEGLHGCLSLREAFKEPSETPAPFLQPVKKSEFGQNQEKDLADERTLVTIPCEVSGHTAAITEELPSGRADPPRISWWRKWRLKF